MKYLSFTIVGLIVVAGIYFVVLVSKKSSQSENIDPDTHLSHHPELNQE